MASGYDCPHCDRTLPSRQARDDHVARAHPDASTSIGQHTGKIVGVLVVLALVVAAGAMVFSGDDGEGSRFSASESPHVGDEDAPVMLVAFESPACTSCRLFHIERNGQPGIVDRIVTNYAEPGRILYVEKYTRAGYAWEDTGAHAQKCAWNMDGWPAFSSLTEHFYDQQGRVSSSNVASFAVGWAREYGLDADAFTDCIEDETHGDEITRDLADGERANVLGTPTFVLVEHDGETRRLPLGEYQEFAGHLDRALQKAERAGATSGANDTAAEDTNSSSSSADGDGNASNDTAAEGTDER